MTDTLTPLLVTPDRCEYLYGSHRLIFNLIEPTSRGITALCEVRWHGNIPAPRVLTFGRYDLLGSRTVSTLASQTIAAQNGKVDEPGLRQAITDAIYDVVTYTLNGAPAIRLADHDPAEERWLLRPLLEAHSATRFIAPGGSRKSTFALGVAITVATGTAKILGLRPKQTGPVVYLDWEADAETHVERLHAICKAHGLDLPLNIHYLFQGGHSLHRSINAVLAACAEIQPVLVIIDSNAMARGVSGEGAAEDSTVRLFTAVRRLQTSSLIVDHKPAELIRRQRRGGYGSVFNDNLARLVWEAEALDPTGAMLLTLTKANNTRTGLQLGYRLTFTEVEERTDQIRFEVVDPASVIVPLQAGTTSGPEPLRVKIWRLLSQSDEPRSVPWLSARLETSDSSVRAQLSRHHNLFEKTSDGPPALYRARGHIGDEGDQDELDNLTDFGRR